MRLYSFIGLCLTVFLLSSTSALAQDPSTLSTTYYDLHDLPEGHEYHLLLMIVDHEPVAIVVIRPIPWHKTLPAQIGGGGLVAMFVALLGYFAKRNRTLARTG